MNGRDRIIDRYINGEMSQAEEQDLQRMMESDPELRQMVEAERMLTRTMLKDRAHLSGIDHSATYATFLAGLASQVPVSEPASHAPTSQAPAGHVPAGSTSGFWSGSFLGKALLSSAAAVLVTVGVWTIQHRASSPAAPAPAAAPATAPAAMTGASTPGTAVTTPSISNAASAPVGSGSASIETSGGTTPIATGSPAGVSTPAARSAAKPAEASRDGRQGSSGTLRSENDEWRTASSDDRNLPVYRSDSIRMQMQANP